MGGRKERRRGERQKRGGEDREGWKVRKKRGGGEEGKFV